MTSETSTFRSTGTGAQRGHLISFFALLGLLFVAFPAWVMFATLHTADATAQERVLPLLFSAAVMVLPASLLFSVVRRKVTTGEWMATDSYARRELDADLAWEWFAGQSAALIKRFLLPGSVVLATIFALAAFGGAVVDRMALFSTVLWTAVAAQQTWTRLRRSRVRKARPSVV